MESLSNNDENTPLPADVGVIEVHNQVRSPSDTISQLSQASFGGVASLSSPIGAKDIGLPKSPQRRVIKPIDETAIDKGYDSDGLRPPWEDGEELNFDGPDVQEEPLPFGSPPSSPRVTSPQNVAEKMCTMEEAEKMKVEELKVELRKRGLPVAGKKIVLLERLKDGLSKKLPLIEQMSEKESANLAGPAFDPSAHWEQLVCDGEFVSDSIPEGFRAPTVPAGEVPLVQKRNYVQTFDRMVFSGKTELPKRYANDAITKKKGEIIFEKRPHNITEVKMKFVRQHKLSRDSHPAHWFQAFLPIKNRGVGMSYSMEHALSWTNLRAMMENGGLGGKYKDFKHFTLHELMKHIGLYLLQGLSPSPQVEMKFHSQSEDPVNGNDFVHRSFGGKPGLSKRRHRHFKCFFTSVDPIPQTPSRDTHPNWKVHPFLKHTLQVSKEAVFMGRNLSCDEQTIGFQGNHKDKQRITYKKEGDGFLADCICSDGYTFSFHFRHQQASEKIMKTFGCSPLHARVLGLISQLPDKYYTLGMDNLYNSAKLCRLCYGMDQKVMVHGVTRPSLRGIPPAIKQEEVKRKGDLEAVRHTVKAAVLKGDSVCKDLLAVSIYDTKPVYFLTSATSQLYWMKKERKVYDPKTKTTFKMPFYRLNIIDFYNNNMGNVDLADQLRNVYRYDSSWHRNRKWWWAIWWWAFQLLLTNSYVLYCKYHKMIDSKQAVSHYDYIKQVALAWINQEEYWPKKQKVASRKRPTQEPIRVTRGRKKLDTGSMSVSSNNSKCHGIKNESLHPTNGKYSCRLNMSVQHFPEGPKTKRARCALHKWSRDQQGPEVFSSVVLCSVCRVHLCLSCYKLFHTEADIIGKKECIAAS